MTKPVRVTVTGAAGNVGYALIFHIASGAMFGFHQPVALSLLEIPQALPALEGVVMELEDCAFPLLSAINMTADTRTGFADVQYALLVGAKPRGKGAKRSDLIEANYPIFVEQGRALNAYAANDVRIAVVGNPANLNCLVTRHHARDIPATRFSALTRLDHNRAVGMLARESGVSPERISGVAIWGNHSATQYPCLTHALIDGHRNWPKLSDPKWIREVLIPRVQNRGAEVIAARGQSSAASAALAIVDHVRDWHRGTLEGQSTSMGIMSEGQYDTPKGVFYSFPVTVQAGDIQVVEGLALDEFDRHMINVTGQELVSERAVFLALS